MRIFQLFYHYLVAFLKGKLEYRVSFFMDIFVQISTNTINYFAIWILLDRFQLINGWNYYEIVFLYTFNLLSFGFCGLFFFAPMVQLQDLVRSGSLDTILIRPINPLLHLVLTNFRHVFFGHIAIGAIMFMVAVNHLTITWNTVNVIWLFLDLLGAALIQAGILLGVASSSFWFIATNEALDTLVWGVRKFLEYPISIYHLVVQEFLIFVIPYAFVNFFPVQYFLGKSDFLFFHPGVQFGTPLVGVLVFLVGYGIWSRGLGRYESTGS